MNIFLIIIAVILFLVVSAYFDHRRMKKIRMKRGEENICKFARDFDYRSIDTKIMREVWNEVQLTLGKFEGKPFPVQSEDLFEQTYKMDHDDLDDIYWTVADKLGIETENTEENPYYEKVTSVKNLVLFLHNQPRIKNA